MATISEIIAARESKGKPAETAAPKPKESIAKRVEAKEAIDRIDPPGKPHKSLVLTSAPIPKPTPPTEPEEPEERSLSGTDGQAVPMTPRNADDVTTAWHQALNAFESELCLMTDPTDKERGWLAARLGGHEDDPILLKSFPLYEHPKTKRPDNKPF